MFDDQSFGESYVRPFTYKLRELRREKRYTYHDLERQCGRARSTSWFNTLLRTRDPWTVNPPSRDALPGLARLLGVTEPKVCAWIADEWYGAVLDRPTRTRPNGDRE